MVPRIDNSKTHNSDKQCLETELRRTNLLLFKAFHLTILSVSSLICFRDVRNVALFILLKKEKQTKASGLLCQ